VVFDIDVTNILNVSQILTEEELEELLHLIEDKKGGPIMQEVSVAIMKYQKEYLTFLSKDKFND